jgi:hypothetical protein
MAMQAASNNRSDQGGGGRGGRAQTTIVATTTITVPISTIVATTTPTSMVTTIKVMIKGLESKDGKPTMWYLANGKRQDWKYNSIIGNTGAIHALRRLRISPEQ